MIFTPPTIPVIPPVSISDRKNGPPTQEANKWGYRLMKYYFNVNSAFRRSRGVNVWRMNDGTYQMSDPVPGVTFTGTIAWPYPDTLQPVNNAISSSWFPGGAVPLGANLLSAADSSFENNQLGTWFALNNTTSSGTTTFAAEVGIASMFLLATGVGDLTTATDFGTYAATPGLPYCVLASFQTFPPAPPRSCFIAIAFYTSGLTKVGQVTSVPFQDHSASWTRAAVLNAVAPPTTAFAQVIVSIAGVQSGEAHMVDNVGLFQSAGATGGSGPGGLQQLVSPGIAIEYLGGHSYAVSSAEAANLTAVGLGAFLS